MGSTQCWHKAKLEYALRSLFWACSRLGTCHVRMDSSQHILSQLNRDYLTCHVCMEIYTCPKVLTCQHSFCKTCLESCEKSKQGVYIICPLCRQQTLLGFKGVQGLKNNFILANMIDMLDEWRKSREMPHQDVTDEQAYKMCQSCPEAEVTMATYQCIDCLDHLCADCAAFHTRTKLTKDHEVVSIQDIENGKHRQKIRFQEMNRCKNHNFIKLDHHCKKCDILVCRDCVIEAHQGHQLSKATTAVDEIKHEIQGMQEEIEAEIQETQNLMDELLLLEENEKVKQEEMEREVKDAAQYFINRIKEKRDLYLHEIKDNFKPKIDHCKNTCAQLKQNVANYNNLIKISHCVTQDEIPFELLDLRKKMSHHLVESRSSFKSLEETHKQQNGPVLRFNYGEITEAVLLSMGCIETVETKKDPTQPADEPESIGDLTKEVMDEVQATVAPANQTDLSIKDESLYSNFQKNKDLFTKDDIVIKPRPLVVRRPSDMKAPVPVPRQRSQSVAVPTTLPRPSTRPKPVVSVKPNISRPPDCYTLTRIKGTVPLPDENKKTVKKHEVPRVAVLPVPQRAAPLPPSKNINRSKSPERPPGSPATTHRRSQSHGAVLEKSPKKSVAPPPPVGLKMSLVGNIGVKREFQGPPVDVVLIDGNIIVLDGEGRQLVTFNKDRKYVKSSKLSDIKAAKITPLAMVSKDKKHLYILYKTFVGRYTIDGVIMMTFGHGDLIDATGLTRNNQGHIIVLDRGKSDIFVFECDGTKLMKFGGAGEKNGQLEDPRFISTTSTDDILVSDCESHQIKCYEKNGKFKFSFGEKGSKDGQLLQPSGIATSVVSNTEVFIVGDEGNSRVCIFDKRGRFISHLIANEPRLQLPKNLKVTDNKLIVTQRNCFQCPVYELQQR